MPGTETGNPDKIATVRPMLWPCAPSGKAQPITQSSSSAEASCGFRCSSAWMQCASPEHAFLRQRGAPPEADDVARPFDACVDSVLPLRNIAPVLIREARGSAQRLQLRLSATRGRGGELELAPTHGRRGNGRFIQ